MTKLFGKGFCEMNNKNTLDRRDVQLKFKELLITKEQIILLFKDELFIKLQEQAE